MRACPVSSRLLPILLGCLWLFAASWAGAQPPQAGGQAFKPEELDQLLAPIALFPDALLAQVLMASTYPLEVVEAARWAKANPHVKEQALEEAMQKQAWDPSVKSLTAVPQVLEMMNDKLDWTQKLGDAFLARQEEVMQTVQRLRKKAHDAGNLKSSKEQTVNTEGSGDQMVIIIEPAEPEVIYVPAYDPGYIYGSWWYPAYPPYYWYPPGYVGGNPGFWFGAGIIAGGAIWGGCDWNHDRVQVNPLKYNQFNRTNINGKDWQHNAEHRRGVAYRDAGVQQKYGQGIAKDTQAREAFRGRSAEANRPGTRQPGAYDGVGQGAEVRNYSNRGAASRGSSGGGMRGGGMRGGGGRR